MRILEQFGNGNSFPRPPPAPPVLSSGALRHPGSALRKAWFPFPVLFSAVAALSVSFPILFSAVAAFSVWFPVLFSAVAALSVSFPVLFLAVAALCVSFPVFSRRGLLLVFGFLCIGQWACLVFWESFSFLAIHPLIDSDCSVRWNLRHLPEKKYLSVMIWPELLPLSQFISSL
ncbi:hypothetical protein CH373_02985 [Leptospira perolatii]|uniref:Uncharacterized protein n=1 Tax=Leptospira perolatii TaxID=2023191 RepID=A0A2M9ZSG1_9LEPT|nr:hypothetical protein CH373_02985 [Leptospira perolatii]